MDATQPDPRLDSLDRAMKTQLANHQARLTTDERRDTDAAMRMVGEIHQAREQLTYDLDAIQRTEREAWAAIARSEADKLAATGETEKASLMRSEADREFGREVFVLSGTEVDGLNSLDPKDQGRRRCEILGRNRLAAIAAAEGLETRHFEHRQRVANVMDLCSEFNTVATRLVARARELNFRAVDSLEALVSVTRGWALNWQTAVPIELLDAGATALNQLIDCLPHGGDPEQAPSSAVLPVLQPHDTQAWQLSQVASLSQPAVAKRLNDQHGTNYSQGQISKMISRAKRHAEASGLAALVEPSTPNPRIEFKDPRILDAGERADGRTLKGTELRKAKDQD